MKKILHVIFTLLSSPLIMTYFILSFFLDKNSLLSAFSQLLSLIPGKTGSFFRISFYRYTLTYCDPDCFIGFATLFSQSNTEIGEGVYIGPQCNIGKSKIDKNCLLGSAVHILSGKRQHHFTDSHIPIKDQGGIFKKVTIGENTWIGNGAIIMANVGKNCIIGAGSVVVHDVEDNCIMSGNPATLLKTRN